MEQGSQEWLEYRKSRIGASEAAIIMGISPYKTVYELWLEKTGRRPQPQMNPAMMYGTKMEPEIREWLEQKHQTWFPAEVVEHPDNPWMIASLDGISADRKTIIEIKTCKESVFKKAQEGEIPPYYMAQAQHQIACVPGVAKVHFVFYHGGEYAEVDVHPDNEFIENMLRLERLFYEQHLLGDLPPAMSEKDNLDMSEDAEWACLALEAKQYHPTLEKEKARFKEYKTKWDDLKKRFIECTDDGNCEGHGVRLTRSWKPGGLDIEKMKADGIDIEKYRKPSTCSVTLTVLKES